MAELYECVQKGGSLTEVQQLLDKGQDINFSQRESRLLKKKDTILHMFCFGYRKNAGTESNKILHLLLEKGAEVDGFDMNYRTPLMWLVLEGFPVDHVELLLRKGADLTKRNGYGLNVLHFFGLMDVKKTGENSLNVLNLLVGRGADINAVDYDDDTPLTLFMRRGFPSDHIEILLKNGANPNHKNKHV